MMTTTTTTAVIMVVTRWGDKTAACCEKQSSAGLARRRGKGVWLVPPCCLFWIKPFLEERPLVGRKDAQAWHGAVGYG